jgi:carbamoyltransferase
VSRVILSVNFNHDGAAAILVDGELAGFVCTERYSRLKKHPGLREEDLDELLDQAGIELADVDHALLCNLHNMDSPDVATLHGSDLKQTWLEFWVNQRNDRVRIRGLELPCTVNPDHHLLHASAAYYSSPFETGVSLAIDPLGCRAFVGRANKLYALGRGYDDWFNANVGYTHVAEYLFSSSIVGAGKVMGLAPYGAPAVAGEDVAWKGIATFAELLELASQDPVYVEVGGKGLNATLAYYVQLGLQLQLSAVLTDLAEVCRRNSIGLNLCLSGGTALNAVANDLCFAESEFTGLHLHPACGDDGTAIGAALWYWHHKLGNPRRSAPPPPRLMYGVRSYSQADVDNAIAAAGPRLRVTRGGDYIERAARLLADRAVVGWFDGPSEVGPRALGHRSILADPTDPTVKDRLNATIKFREHFRPFAPSVLNTHAQEWFGLRDSPFMLRACPVRRPDLPAITHVDGTSRIQTVEPADNPAYHALISRFHELTGVPLVLNTSLNTKGYPIDETPADALRTLLATELDYLIFPGTIVGKSR